MFVPGETFQISLMFASKAGAYSSGALVKNSNTKKFLLDLPANID
jgi:hypothetical protein